MNLLQISFVSFAKIKSLSRIECGWFLRTLTTKSFDHDLLLLHGIFLGQIVKFASVLYAQVGYIDILIPHQLKRNPDFFSGVLAENLPPKCEKLMFSCNFVNIKAFNASVELLHLFNGVFKLQFTTWLVNENLGFLFLFVCLRFTRETLVKIDSSPIFLHFSEIWVVCPQILILLT